MAKSSSAEKRAASEKKPEKAEKRPPAKAAAKPPAPPKPAAKPHKPQVAFPKKNQPPTPAAFAARFPLALGKRFDQVRAFLLKQAGVTEDVCYYGPQTGWALRYLASGRSLCSLHVYDERPVGIVALEPAATEEIDWKALSAIGQQSRKQAHGSPALLWVDVPLDGAGAADFKTILRAKLATQEASPGAAG